MKNVIYIIAVVASMIANDPAGKMHDEDVAMMDKQVVVCEMV